jgi:hypothetical protein
MNKNPDQLSLFPARRLFGCDPELAFALEPSPDEIRICTGCGRQIITQRRTTAGLIVGEYVGRNGECFTCAHPKR